MKRRALTITVLALVLTPALAAQGLRAEQGWVEQYCTSTANSTGFAAKTDVIGDLRITTNDTWLVSSDCPPGQFGVFLMGTTPTRLPYGDGFLCISPFDTPIYRLGPPSQPDFMGTTLKHLDFNAYPLPGMCIHSGSTWYFQCYYRDAQAGGTGFNLGSGVAAYFVQ